MPYDIEQIRRDMLTNWKFAGHENEWVRLYFGISPEDWDQPDEFKWMLFEEFDRFAEFDTDEEASAARRHTNREIPLAVGVVCDDLRELAARLVERVSAPEGREMVLRSISALRVMVETTGEALLAATAGGAI